MCTSGPVPDREASGMITSKPLWKWRGCGKRGKPKAGFPRFPQPLGNLAQTARFPHSHSGGGPRWKSGKPKAGFPLFHAPVRDDDSCLFLSKLPGTYHNHRKENTRRARKALAGHWNQMSVSGSSRTGIKLRFQAHFWIGKCLKGGLGKNTQSMNRRGFMTAMGSATMA